MFYVALTGLERNIGDIIPRAMPWAGLFCPCRAEDGQTLLSGYTYFFGKSRFLKA